MNNETVGQCYWCKQGFRPGEPVVYMEVFGSQRPTHSGCQNRKDSQAVKIVVIGIGVAVVAGLVIWGFTRVVG